MITADTPGTPIEVFISYSHRDEPLRRALEDHLSLLRRQSWISTWHDRRSAGTEWVDQIDAHLESARMILLLVSPNFMASEYCYGVELRRALERHAAGEARVIPVILRPVDWKDAPFGKLQSLPKDGKPVTSWRNRDGAFANIGEGIRRAIEDLRSTVLSRVQSLALKYENVRTIKTGGDPLRISLMEEIVEDLKKLAAPGSYWLPKLVQSPESGEKLAAIVILQVIPNPEYLHWVEQRVGDEQPFLSYQATVALREAAGTLSIKYREQLSMAINFARENLPLSRGDKGDRMRKLEEAAWALSERL